MTKIRYSDEFICPKCGSHTALLCLTDGAYQAHCMICDAYYDVEIAKHRKKAKKKQSIKSDHRDWPQTYAWRDCSKCENLFCKNSGEDEDKIKFAYCDHYREGEMMYEELVEKLRDDNACLSISVLHEAADAIEELQATICNWCAICPKDKRDLSTCEIYESCRAEPPKEG